LIWRLWPETHVFVDTRHDLTPEMWPIFLAAHAPGTRLVAMEEAFRRWGLGLSVFRGPTFPLVQPARGWQLLFKAGEQELYQRLDSRLASTNIARARAWLRARTSKPDQDLSALAVQVGAERWLRAPYQLRRARKAGELLRSGDAEDAMSGLSLQAELLFDAGDYGQALARLEQVLARSPRDTKAAYKALLAALALGRRPQAQRWFSLLRERATELSSTQQSRLHAIAAAGLF
jgi:tetratricopeptide (TPR) repeat protein